MGYYVFRPLSGKHKLKQLCALCACGEFPICDRITFGESTVPVLVVAKFYEKKVIPLGQGSLAKFP